MHLPKSLIGSVMVSGKGSGKAVLAIHGDHGDPPGQEPFVLVADP